MTDKKSLNKMLKKSLRKSIQKYRKTSKRKSRKPCVYGMNQHGCCNKKPSVKKTKRCLEASKRRLSPCKYGVDENGCCNKRPTQKYIVKCRKSRRSRKCGNSKSFDMKNLLKKLKKSIRKSFKNKKTNINKHTEHKHHDIHHPKEKKHTEHKYDEYKSIEDDKKHVEKEDSDSSLEEMNKEYYKNVKNQDIINNKAACERLMCLHNISKNPKDYKNFSLKHHPDKGGDRTIWDSVNNCRSLDIYCPDK